MIQEIERGGEEGRHGIEAVHEGEKLVQAVEAGQGMQVVLFHVNKPECPARKRGLPPEREGSHPKGMAPTRKGGDEWAKSLLHWKR